MEDRPWPEWRHGKPITVRQVARLLKPFGITPGTIRTQDSTPKGYYLTAFDDAFSRYPPISSATTPQPIATKASSENPVRHKANDVADEKSPKPAVGNVCGSVADEKGGLGGEGTIGQPEPNGREIFEL
jgi:putative DNA primase/helicase